MRNIVAALALTLAALPASHAQTVIRTPRAGAFTLTAADDKDRAMLGISTSTGGRRDTLGLLISSVTAGSPAEKAGLEEGNRLLSINGVNLKLSRDDAADEDMQGVNQNRLVREMRKVKPGDDVTLEVWAGGRSRSVKAKTVSAAELNPARTLPTGRDEDRAALGVFLSSSGNKRDTIGVFVRRIVDGGPADKAGIIEGDRIANINGVDTRVAREDAGDWSIGSSRIDRLEREVRKLKPGQSADLVIVSGGSSRSVKVTVVKATELPGGEMSGFSYGTGENGGVRVFGPNGGAMRMTVPNGGLGPNGVRITPRIRLSRGSDGEEICAQIEDGLQGLRGLDGLQGLEGLRGLGSRIQMELDHSVPRAMDEMRWKLNEELPRAMEEMRRSLRDDAPRRVTIRSVNRVIL